MQPDVYLGRTLLPPGHRDLCVNIVNTTVEPKTVAVGEWLGNLHDVEVQSGQEWNETLSDQQQSGTVSTTTEPVDVRAAAASSTLTEIVDSLLQYTWMLSNVNRSVSCCGIIRTFSLQVLTIWDVLTGRARNKHRISPTGTTGSATSSNSTPRCH